MKKITSNEQYPEKIQDTEDPYGYFAVVSLEKHLGSHWQEYFVQEETIKTILREAMYHKKLWEGFFSHLTEFQAKEKAAEFVNFTMPYEYVTTISSTPVDNKRFSVIFMAREVCSGVMGKWIIDISTGPITWNQIMDVLYGIGSECVGRIIINCQEIARLSANDFYYPIFMRVMAETGGFKNNIHMLRFIEEVQGDVSTLGYKESLFGVAVPDRRKKIPSRSALEKKLWGEYYVQFMPPSTMFKTDYYGSHLITEDIYKSNIPLFVYPTWTAKGLFLNLIRNLSSDSEEWKWLLNIKRDEIAKYYPGCRIGIRTKNRKPWYIFIQVNNTPLREFIEASWEQKVEYFTSIRDQQLTLIHHVEDIFEDFNK